KGATLGLDRLRPQPLVVLAGEVEVDRHRLPDNQVAVLECRYVPIRVDAQVLALAGVARREVHLHVLVGEFELLEHPECAHCPGLRYAVELDHRLLLSGWRTYPSRPRSATGRRGGHSFLQTGHLQVRYPRVSSASP